MADFKIDPNAERIVIPKSRKKVLLLLLVTVLLLIAGLWIITNQDNFKDLQDGYRHAKTRLIISGYLLTILSGLCTIGFIFILINNKPVLVIDDKGIAIGPFGQPNYVSWFDIKDFEIGAFNNVAFINIRLINEDKFISEQKSAIKRKLISFNIRQTGSPLNISTSALKCDFNQLYDLLCDRLEEFKAAERETHYSTEA